ncbi:MAG: succinylglutamate desuccinylase/aspartoacylase family protein [Chitinophagales bacterium]
MERHNRRGLAVLAGAAVLTALSAAAFLPLHRPDPIHPGPGVTRVTRLSAWNPELAGSAGDTPVFVLRGKAPGGTALVLGGTHGDETAGYVSALLLVERARVERGTLIVIPRANASGFTHNVPQEGHPQHFYLTTTHGRRRFTYGARATNPVHQWPDPQVYLPAGSSQVLSGSETRNLNRAYPGRRDGTLTERVAFGITQLIRREKVALAIDLHEASPEYPVVNTIVAHPRATDLAAVASMNLEAQGVRIGLEPSPETLRGLSHREWGDTTPALAILMETTNPAQGRLRGATGARLVTDGQDRFYLAAAGRRQLSVPFTAEGWPLRVRVARHVTAVREFLSSLGDLDEAAKIEVTGLPDYAELAKRGPGPYLW